MDKNIAALIREDAKTVQVSFNPGAGTAKTYTYITDLPVAVGDYLVVDVSGEFKVVCVSFVDEDLSIEPNADIKYKWVVAKIDLDYHNRNQQKNAEIEKLLKTAYVSNIRHAFRSQLLGSVDTAIVTRLDEVLSK